MIIKFSSLIFVWVREIMEILFNQKISINRLAYPLFLYPKYYNLMILKEH